MDQRRFYTARVRVLLTSLERHKQEHRVRLHQHCSSLGSILTQTI